MRLFPILILCLFSLVACKTTSNSSIHHSLKSNPSESQVHEHILEIIAEKEAELGATLGVSLVTPGHPGVSLDHNGDRLFHAASTMKIPVMIEVFKRSDAGEFNVNDLVTVNENCRSYLDDSAFVVDADKYLAARIGEKETILRLTEEMMVVSDNLATNQLIAMTGPSKITGTMRGLGATKGYVLRGVQDIPAYEAGLSNRLTPNDLSAMLSAIEEGRAGNESSTPEMKRILLAQHYTDMIPHLLPEGTLVGHKTGSITGLRHDAAIVYAPFGTYYLTILSEGLQDPAAGKLAIAEISKAIYDDLEMLSKN